MLVHLSMLRQSHTSTGWQCRMLPMYLLDVLSHFWFANIPSTLVLSINLMPQKCLYKYRISYIGASHWYTGNCKETSFVGAQWKCTVESTVSEGTSSIGFLRIQSSAGLWRFFARYLSLGMGSSNDDFFEAAVIWCTKYHRLSVRMVWEYKHGVSGKHSFKDLHHAKRDRLAFSWPHSTI